MTVRERRTKVDWAREVAELLRGFKSRNAEVDFHGEKRTNETHESRTDPEAKLHRKGAGKEATLCHMGHALGEHRNGLIVAIAVTEANGMEERSSALSMLDGVNRLLR